MGFRGKIAVVRLVVRALPVCGALLACGCCLVRLTGDTVVATGKVAATAVKTTGTVVGTTAKVGVMGVSYFAGTRRVDLERDGQSFYVAARLNGHRARLLLDTGATHVQITPRLAHKLGIKVQRGSAVNCTLANGASVQAWSVSLKDVRIGGARVRDVATLVLGTDSSDDCDGLLGMSFLDQFVFRIDPVRNQLVLRCR